MRSVWPVTFLTLFLCLTIAEAGKGLKVDDMTEDALQTLFDEVGEDKAEKAKKVTALYRKDLDADYIAYYEVKFKKSYYIIRSGEATGGHEVVTIGEDPEPTKVASDDAKSRKAKCVKYYLMNTGGDVMCSDKNGKIVGTSVPISLVVAGNSGDFKRGADGKEEKEPSVDPEKLDEAIKAQSAELEKDFKENNEKSKVEDKEDEGEDGENKSERSAHDDFMHLMKRRPENADENEKEPKGGDEKVVARAITPGKTEKLVTGNVKKVKEIRVRFLKSGEGEAVKADHKKLCKVLRGCDPSTATDKYAKLKPDHITQHKVHVDLELLEETEQKYNKEEFVFAVDIVTKKEVKTRHYGVMYEDEESKRYIQYRSWSSWYYWDIPRRNLFPDYWNVWAGRCYAGYGAVAWASVFAYYDRRSHYDGNYWRSKMLYRSSYDGTYGSSNQIAPYRPDTRLYNYIKYISRIIKTFCRGNAGENYYSKMDYVYSFFWWRNYGNPRIYESSRWYWVRDRLMQKWPVVAIWKNGNYRTYVVATRLARQYRYYRSCTFKWWWCGSWRIQYNYWMWVRVGWGYGRGNRWIRLDTPHALVAMY